MAGFHPELLSSAGASWANPVGSSTSRIASGVLPVICDAWLLSGGGASTIWPPTVPSSSCQAWVKSWLMVSALGSALAATFTVWPSTPPRLRSIALASASPSVETGRAVLSTRS